MTADVSARVVQRRARSCDGGAVDVVVSGTVVVVGWATAVVVVGAPLVDVVVSKIVTAVVVVDVAVEVVLSVGRVATFWSSSPALASRNAPASTAAAVAAPAMAQRA